MSSEGTELPQPVTQQGQDPNDMGICCTFLIRLWGVISAVLIVICGIVRVISITPLCLVAGLYLILFGLVTFLMEAPIILTFLPTAAPLLGCINKYLRPWVRCIFYIIVLIPPVAMCPTISVILAALLWFVTFSLNAVLVIGAKGKDRNIVNQRQDFSMRNVSSSKAKSEDTTTLMGNIEGGNEV
ncbi:Calcium channel flower-like protein isoform X1 [Oopsacas minuta]|uniref:Calcium channel flower-like protein isoform X1 n=1 Tax=Oopsacas minuta TaxID=111878 RepID=A0AAV7JLP0_9METZ|nr:Calcium channel flower-like protein isoform X1 [Oopsacas minuta]